MRKEEFEEVLIRQYTDTINEFIYESESVYRSQVDYQKLDFRVKSLLKCARIDGLKEELVWKILERKIPGYIQHINSNSKMAA
jgi:hypothetical protein